MKPEIDDLIQEAREEIQFLKNLKNKETCAYSWKCDCKSCLKARKLLDTRLLEIREYLCFLWSLK